MAEYIEREAAIRKMQELERYAWAHPNRAEYRSTLDVDDVKFGLHYLPKADVVEVVHSYQPGDVCIYGFGDENKSCAVVEIVRVLSDERGVAEVKFLKVFVDDTGNGYFNYLLRSGNTMNASFKYLKNITPRTDGEEDG